MGNLFYAIALATFMAWAIAFFAFDAGVVIHLLLIIPIIALILKAFQRRRAY